jgi:hypothetical protein
MLIVALLSIVLLSCGGEGGDVGGGTGTTLTGTTPDGETLVCDLGNNNSFTFTVGDNASLNFCTVGGGTVKPDNSTVNEPTNSNNRTTNVNPTPTPGVSLR